MGEDSHEKPRQTHGPKRCFTYLDDETTMRASMRYLMEGSKLYRDCFIGFMGIQCI